MRGIPGMTANGRKPPHSDKLTVMTVEPSRNAKSCVGNQITQQNTMVEPTRPDAMRMDVIVRKLTAYGIVGLMYPWTFVNKITVVRSREVAAPLLVEMGIVGNKDEIPTFLGRDFVHVDKVTKSLSGMVSSLQ